MPAPGLKNEDARGASGLPASTTVSTSSPPHNSPTSTTSTTARLLSTLVPRPAWDLPPRCPLARCGAAASHGGGLSPPGLASSPESPSQRTRWLRLCAHEKRRGEAITRERDEEPPLHRRARPHTGSSRDPIRLRNVAPPCVARGAANGLYECGVAPEETFLVGV